MSEHLDLRRASRRLNIEPATRHDRRADPRQVLGNAALGRVLNASDGRRSGATAAQRVDESVARAVESRRTHGLPRRGRIQRKEGMVDPPGAGGADGDGTTRLTIHANYSDVPGKGKNRIEPRQADNALWVTAAVQSHDPKAVKSDEVTGVVTGIGEKNIGSLDVPVSDAEPPSGRGSLTAGLRFGRRLDTTFDVKVDCDGFARGQSKAKAASLAKSFLVKQMRGAGDVEYLQQETAKYLSDQDYTNPVVTISMKENRASEDLGQPPPVYYNAHKDPTILLEIGAQEAGESQTGGSSTTESKNKVGTKDESHSASSTKTETVDKHSKTTETFSTFRENVEKYREEKINTLWDRFVDKKDSSSRSEEKERTKIRSSEEFNRELDKSEKSGTKTDRNWAAQLLRIISKLEQAIQIPVIGKYLPPGIKRWAGGWQLQILKLGLELFAEETPVKFTDTKEKLEESRSSKWDKDSKKSSESEHHDSHVVDNKHQLTEIVKRDSRQSWTEFIQNTKELEEHCKTVTRESSEGRSSQVNVDTEESRSATVSWTTNWKWSKPTLKATVVRGDAEVSADPRAFVTDGVPKKVESERSSDDRVSSTGAR